MKYKTFLVLQEKDKASVSSLWEQYVKAASGDDKADTGSFKVIATSDDVDRDGEVIAIDGWDFANYEKNPVVLWGHDFSLMPVGKVTKLTREGNKIIAEGVFAPTERGQEVRKAYEGEFLNTVSVGFIPRERKGNTITKSELLELSFVPVPANANAVALRAMEELKTKMAKLEGKDAADDEEEVEMMDHEVTQEDLDNNPDLASAGVQVGEVIQVPVPESEKSAKGIVADVADAMGNVDEMTWNAKYGNMCQVSQIIGALWEVYMRPEMGVDDFDGLLKETIDLLSGVLGTRVQSEGLVAQNVKAIDGKGIAKAIADNFALKSGRVLSAKNRDLVKSAVDALTALLDASSTEDEGKGAEPENQPAPADDATAKGQGLTDESIEQISAAVLRGIDKAVGKELRDIKRGKE